MKTSEKMASYLMKSIAIFGIAAMLGCSESADQSIRLFGVSDLVRVFEDGYNLPPAQDTLYVFGIRNEIVSGQCVIFSKDSISGVAAEISDLTDQKTGMTLPAAIVEWNFVGSVPLSDNTPNQPKDALSRPAPANYPEYLMAENQMNLESGTYQSIWLTINIPENTEAGIYTGKVSIKSQQGEQSLPMNLQVYPFNLSTERHLKIVEWYSTEEFARFHGIEEKYSDAWFSMLGVYAENMVAHRQNSFRVHMNVIDIRRTKSGRLEFDFSLFDRIAQVFWNTGKMDYLETGFLTKFGDGAWFSTEILLKDFPVTDLKTGEQIELGGEEVIPLLLPAFEKHLRMKGWLDKTMFHVKDEPSLHNAVAWMEMSSYMHKYAPGLQRIDAIETPFLLDDIEIAVPKLDALTSWYESFSKWQQKGNELWFYTVGIYQASYLPNKTIDMPLMDTRIMHWLNYKYDAIGYLHWGWNQWNENPYQDVGMHYGDAWHVYPVKDGVLNSLRWEQMRNGIQDYEYFWMLENKITALKDSLGSGFSWIDPTQRSKEIADQVVMSLVEHTDDPQMLYQAKREVIIELLEFDASPRIYIQTDPYENSAMTNHSSVGVLGWTEPGTKIVVNGKEIPVSEEGLFLDQFGLSPEGNKIIVQASTPDASREIVRDYIIE
ncbi:glycoside hydrolase domain-containing protein [Bacteroidota bacterium]